MQDKNRRDFLRHTAAIGSASVVSGLALPVNSADADTKAPKGQYIQFGLCTYLWGKDYDLPSLIKLCEDSGVMGVELRTVHKHGVEPTLSKDERKEVRKRFADSPVELVGYGSNAQFHEADPQKLKHNIELTKQYIHLMHDCGGTGVKVKPNDLPKNVPEQKTIEQIGKALNEVAEYGAGFGQEIRVEVHGRGTSSLPVIKSIFDVADNRNVGICWNSNDADLAGKGLKHNFDLVKDRFGHTVHVRELGSGNYPYAELMNWFVEADYHGWVLLEARSEQKDMVAAMKEQLQLFNEMTGSLAKR